MRRRPSGPQRAGDAEGPCVFATVCTPGQSSQTLLQRYHDQGFVRRFMRWGQGTQGSADRFAGCCLRV